MLFHPFIQADGTVTRKFGGTGLGLTISKKLVELMDGEIGVESEEGVGSTFWIKVCFPEVLEKEDRDKDVGVIAKHLRDTRILVIDDNLTYRNVLNILLTQMNCRVETISDSEFDISKLIKANEAAEPFHIVILDKKMPSLDGKTIGRMIKEEPLLKNTSLILMTSAGERGDAAYFEEIGFAAYLNKPIKQSILYDCILTILRRRIDPKSASEKMITRHSVAEKMTKKIRILVAEDNNINQIVVLKLLNKLGYQADAVANGSEAIEALKTIRYNLILTDIKMPVMNGLDATKSIRKSDSKQFDPQIPIIALTAHATEEYHDNSKNAGMNDHIIKPIEPEILDEILQRYLLKYESKPKKFVRKIDIENTNKIFDKNALFERVGNDEGIMLDVIAAYLEDIPEKLESLKDAIDEGDLKSVGLMGHTIKGASTTIGALVENEIAKKMELVGKEINLNLSSGILEKLENEFELFKQITKEFTNINVLDHTKV